MKKKLAIGAMIGLCALALAGLCACNVISGTNQNLENGSPHPNENVNGNENTNTNNTNTGNIEVKPTNTDTSDISAASAKLDSAMMKLALEENSDSTIFYSPYGAASAFAILANAAGDGTPIANDVIKALGYDDLDQMTADFKGANEVAPLTDGYGFSSVGLVLYDETNLGGKVELDEKIASDLDTYLATNIKKEDFAGNLDQAKKDIQMWASDATQGFINDFESQAETYTAADILNAVYFKGKWSLPFDPQRTYEREFTSITGEKQKADFMNETFEKPSEVSYYEDCQFKGIRLDYQDAAEPISMYIILPIDDDDTNGTKAWAEATDEYKATFKSHIDKDSMDYDELHLSLPKLEFRQKADITKVAGMIGADAAISGGALELLGPNVSNVKLDQIYQDAKVRIDEEGTEAAAVTEMTMKATSVPTNEIIKTFNCDRPYVFMITGNSNDVTYFTGLVNSIEPDMRIK